MKIKKTFLTHTVAGTQIMVPVGESAKDFRGFVRNNETAAFIVDQFRNDMTIEEVTQAILDTYEVDPDTARKDVEYIVGKLKELNAFE